MATMNTTTGIVYVKSISGNILITGSMEASGDVRAGTNNVFYWNNSSVISAPSNGVIRLANSAQTDFGRLQFGGTTSSFPALERNGIRLDVRLADDSADGNIAAGTVIANAAFVGPGTVASTGAIRLANNNAVYWRNAADSTEHGWALNTSDILVTTAPANVASGTATPAGGGVITRIAIGSAGVGVYIGTGVPTVSAPKGSLYTRTDATTTTTRLYVNTDGGTTWTNFTSAA